MEKIVFKFDFLCNENLLDYATSELKIDTLTKCAKTIVNLKNFCELNARNFEWFVTNTVNAVKLLCYGSTN